MICILRNLMICVIYCVGNTGKGIDLEGDRELHQQALPFTGGGEVFLAPLKLDCI